MTYNEMTGPEAVDINGPWWHGYYQGWRDHDDGRAPVDVGEDVSPWSTGYDAGWIARCCEGCPHKVVVGAAGCAFDARPGGHPAWN